VASEVHADADLDEDEVALLPLQCGRVRRWGVRYPSGLDEVGGRYVSAPE
jgi:hypothetical protein